MSSTRFYADLLGMRSRIDGVRRAVSTRVQAGDRVVEIGTGVGTFAFFAARAGAEHVWAIEARSVIRNAEAIALEEGLEHYDMEQEVTGLTELIAEHLAEPER